MKKEYAVYKGEDHIAFGTLEELAEKLDVQPRTIYFYSTEVYKRRIEKRNAKNAMVAVCLDD